MCKREIVVPYRATLLLVLIDQSLQPCTRHVAIVTMRMLADINVLQSQPHLASLLHYCPRVQYI